MGSGAKPQPTNDLVHREQERGAEGRGEEWERKEEKRRGGNGKKGKGERKETGREGARPLSYRKKIEVGAYVTDCSGLVGWAQDSRSTRR